MNNTKDLETLYLQAKIAYYEGAPIMSDTEFDALERKLKDLNSKVIEQVGSKRSDFDFPHPRKMLSLSKIQTENINGMTDYKNDLFLKWFTSKLQILKISESKLYYSPKFDGNAINIIYNGNRLSRILTRGDGTSGKNITDRFKDFVPDDLAIYHYDYKDTDIIEIRCEVVIAMAIFNAKYSEFANARNFVAGVIGKDDHEIEKVNDLTIIPLHYMVNGIHVEPNSFIFEDFFKHEYFYTMCIDEYETVIRKMEEMRTKFPYQLDGVVCSFPEKYRAQLGEDSHAPEWSIAIKFVPEEAVTEVIGIDWNVGKTGENIPTILLKPVNLAGTVVKRTSGYNAGYIQTNKLGNGSIVTMIKSGDIIPCVKTILYASDSFVLPTACPECVCKLTFDGIHLMCNNLHCPGKIVKKLHTAAKDIDMKNVGKETLRKFSCDFDNLYELMIWVLDMSNNHKEFERFGFKSGSRSLTIFIDSFKNIRSLSVAKVILLFGHENVGLKLTEQVAKMYYDIEPDFKCQEKALVGYFKQEHVRTYILDCVKNLESFNIKIDKPLNREDDNMKTTIYICMTGTPVPVNKTKEEFISQFSNIEEVSLTDKKCNYLITNSVSSETSKMKMAKKKNIDIITYEDFINKFKSL